MFTVIAGSKKKNLRPNNYKKQNRLLKKLKIVRSYTLPQQQTTAMRFKSKLRQSVKRGHKCGNNACKNGKHRCVCKYDNMFAVIKPYFYLLGKRGARVQK